MTPNTPTRKKNLPAVISDIPKGSPDDRLVALWLHGRPDSTVKVYRTAVEAMVRSTGGKPLAAVTLPDLQRHQDALARFKPATRAKRLNAIKSLYSFAFKLGYLPVDPARALRLPKKDDHLAARIPSAEDVRRIVAGEPDPLKRAMLLLLYATGARVSEWVRIRWEDCHPHGDSGVVSLLGKGDKARVVRLPPVVWAELAAFRPAGGSGFVLPSPYRPGRSIDPATGWAWFKAAALRAGFKLPSPHWFRHAHASHALDAGAPVHLVATTLGHASLATTTRYAHARPGESSGLYLDLGPEVDPPPPSGS